MCICSGCQVDVVARRRQIRWGTFFLAHISEWSSSSRLGLMQIVRERLHTWVFAPKAEKVFVSHCYLPASSLTCSSLAPLLWRLFTDDFELTLPSLSLCLPSRLARSERRSCCKWGRSDDKPSGVVGLLSLASHCHRCQGPFFDLIVPFETSHFAELCEHLYGVRW